MGFRAATLAAAVLASSPFALRAQEAHGSHHHEEESRVEADLFASDVFAAGTLGVRAWKKLAFEGHYFYVSEHNIGILGANWGFEWKGLELMPGLGGAFGSPDVKSVPVFILRWLYDRPRFVTEGMLVQSISMSSVKDEHSGHVREFYATLLDNVHASARLSRFEIGPTIERIQYREENQWKYGGRLAFQAHKKVSLVLVVLTPGKTEFRGGIVYR
jgi:hypothetical protein